MYRMLIVEDERWEREGLVDLWDWSELGVRIEDTAADGIEGCEKALEIKPDIIITDIRMPGMSGLEMARNIREQLPEVRIIVLTGYSDFEYTREAITMNADDYVLKPIEEEELRLTMLSVIEKCRQIGLRRDREMDMMERIQIGKRLEAEKYLTCLLLNRNGDHRAMAAELQKLNPALEAADYTVSVVVSHESVDPEEIISELSPKWYVMPCDACDGGLTLIIPLADSLEEEHGIAGQLKSLENVIRQPVVIGLGKHVSSLEMLGESYGEAVSNVSYGMFFERTGLVTMADVTASMQQWSQTANVFRSKWLNLCRELRICVLKLEENMASNVLQVMFDLLRNHPGAGKNYISTLVQTLLLDLSVLKNDHVWDHHGGSAAGRQLDSKDLIKINRLQDLHDAAQAFISVLMGGLDSKRNRKDDYIAERTIQLIEENYASSALSLAMLADQMFLSQNHLGVLFKKATGRTVHQFIIDYRMRKAEELLNRTKQKVSEVAERIGMSNHSYFCALFKQKYGMSPGEYQELMQRR
ncbi:response regulator transcription factor [Paenibacillus lemnae]|uniref:Response regulator n=1 Tax=Paenibacillus lemnae TaxID=1330551 RepID=A0A848M5B3_PAELE|nr:response regulator [Paenibacillus lemnae]NMO95449.1 response regulator [Paenibacillus lemnae]